ncbi:6087_t:CDS:1 [Ambispora gerdemannii]|uniref:6087_t:CDS:1 n=1 Tax=Ambispora gerdemannii TaxID=144530 RepID=A0A9N9E1I6_9GLOM|nr:6087_t:CDS:1 [Ambispora gerdemannii]
MNPILNSIIFDRIIINEIFKNIATSSGNPNSLFSCIFVNRRWYKSAIPFIWKDPCKILTRKIIDRNSAFCFISTVLKCISIESKRTLRKEGILLEHHGGSLEVLPPVSDYPVFLEVLSPNILCKCIAIWMNQSQQHSTDKRSVQYKEHILQKEIFELFINKRPSICALTLSTQHMESNSNIIPSELLPYLSNSFEWLTKLRKFKHNVSNNNPPDIFFYAFSQHATNLESIKLWIDGDDNKGDQGIVALFETQKNLKKLKIYSQRRSCLQIDNALFKVANTLKKLTLNHSLCVSPMPIKKFIGLESLTVNLSNGQETDSHSAEEFFVNLSSAYFKTLKVLNIKVVQKIRLASITSFIRLNGRCLREFTLNCQPVDAYATKNFVEAIRNDCPNLKKMEISIYENGPQLKKLLTMKRNSKT